MISSCEYSYNFNRGEVFSNRLRSEQPKEMMTYIIDGLSLGINKAML